MSVGICNGVPSTVHSSSHCIPCCFSGFLFPSTILSLSIPCYCSGSLFPSFSLCIPCCYSNLLVSLFCFFFSLYSLLLFWLLFPLYSFSLCIPCCFSDFLFPLLCFLFIFPADVIASCSPLLFLFVSVLLFWLLVPLIVFSAALTSCSPLLFFSLYSLRLWLLVPLYFSSLCIPNCFYFLFLSTVLFVCIPCCSDLLSPFCIPCY